MSIRCGKGESGVIGVQLVKVWRHGSHGVGKGVLMGEAGVIGGVVGKGVELVKV